MLINIYATMQDANISPQQICMLKVMFRALCILEYACGIEHSCTCKCVHVVSLLKIRRYHGNAEQSIQREREIGEALCLSPCTTWRFLHCDSLQGLLIIVISRPQVFVSLFHSCNHSFSANFQITFPMRHTFC